MKGSGFRVQGSEKESNWLGVLGFFSMDGENIFWVGWAGAKGLGNKELGCLFFRQFSA